MSAMTAQYDIHNDLIFSCRLSPLHICVISMYVFPFLRLNTSAPLHYSNNKETAYYVEGHVEYTWDDGKYSHEFHQVYL